MAKMFRGGVCPGEMASGCCPKCFSPLPVCLGEERLELGVGLIGGRLFPPILYIVDEDAGGGDGGDGGVQNLLG